MKITYERKCPYCNSDELDFKSTDRKGKIIFECKGCKKEFIYRERL